MVFGFRKKKSAVSPPSPLRRAPSLPDVNGRSEAIAWPPSLVDENEMARWDTDPNANPAEFGEFREPRSARKISFSHSRSTPFHRPFRPYASLGAGSEPDTPKSPPTAFRDGNRISTFTTRSASRRAKLSPSFNIMVVGSRGVGKSSFLRLLLETSDIAPTATLDQRSALETFLSPPHQTTKEITPVSIELLGNLLLTVIDTPGLDFREGRELVLETQVNSIVREIEQRYAESMIEESKVVRSSGADKHIHLCIYMIDPNTLEPAEDRILHPSDRRSLLRLHQKTNVLPIIGRIDTLTEEKLMEVSAAVKREIQDIGIGFTVFQLPRKRKAIDDRRSRSRTRGSPTRAANDNSKKNRPPPIQTLKDDEDTSSSEEESEEPQTPSPKVIKIRSTRAQTFSMSQTDSAAPRKLRKSRSQSRIRRAQSHANVSDEEFDLARGVQEVDDLTVEELDGVADSVSVSHDDHGGDEATALPVQRSQSLVGPRRAHRLSIASSRFAAAGYQYGLVAGGNAAETEPLLPFGLVNPSPAPMAHPNPKRFSMMAMIGAINKELDNGEVVGTPVLEGGFGEAGNEESLFTRKYRWGTIDVLNPAHCDFVPMRAAMFGWGMKALKLATKDAYERYRTEKLLIHRAKSLGYGLDRAGNPAMNGAAASSTVRDKSRTRRPSVEVSVSEPGHGGSGRGKRRDEWVDVSKADAMAPSGNASKVSVH